MLGSENSDLHCRDLKTLMRTTRYRAKSMLGSENSYFHRKDLKTLMRSYRAKSMLGSEM